MQDDTAAMRSHAHFALGAALHEFDMTHDTVPVIRWNAEIALERALQLEQQNQGRAHDDGYGRSHHEVHVFVFKSEEPAEPHDARRTDHQDEPLEWRHPRAVAREP